MSSFFLSLFYMFHQHDQFLTAFFSHSVHCCVFVETQDAKTCCLQSMNCILKSERKTKLVQTSQVSNKADHLPLLSSVPCGPLSRVQILGRWGRGRCHATAARGLLVVTCHFSTKPMGSASWYWSWGQQLKHGGSFSSTAAAIYQSCQSTQYGLTGLSHSVHTLLSAHYNYLKAWLA